MAAIVPLAIIAPLTVCIGYYKGFSSELRIFSLYLLLNGLGNLCAHILASFSINNLPLLHIYTVLEFLLISLFYKKIFDSPLVSKIIVSVSISFTAFAILNAIFFQSIYVFNSYPRSTGSIIIVIYTLGYFKKSLDSLTFIDATRKVLLYINAALLLYFGGSFVLFASANMIMSNAFMYIAFWTVHATLVLIMYTIFTIGLLHAKRNR